MNKLTLKDLCFDNDGNFISFLEYTATKITNNTIRSLLNNKTVKYEVLGKFGSLYVKNFINIMASTINLDTARIEAGYYIATLYDSKWSSLSTLFLKNFDPLAPFDITLSEESTDTFRTIEDQYTKTGSSSTIDKDTTTMDKTLTGRKEANFTENKESDKDSTTEVLEDKVSSKQDNSIYGFNSSNAVPSDSIESNTDYNSKTQSSETSNDDTSSTNIEDNTDSISGTESKDRSVTGTTSDTTSHKYSRENPKTREYTRKGNIGNITKQELFLKEVERLKVLLLPIIYEDICTALCTGTFKED